jgi:nucleotide-binding universal stress UspA family protein
MFTHLLIPTDGSNLSRAAVRKGVQLAKALNAGVTGITVVPEQHVYLYQTDITEQVKKETVREHRLEAERRLEVVRKVAGEAGVACETVVESGDHPFEVIVAAAKKRACDLIVMASHGRRGVTGVLLGSETQKVLTHSSIPVLVFR